MLSPRARTLGSSGTGTDSSRPVRLTCGNTTSGEVCGGIETSGGTHSIPHPFGHRSAFRHARRAGDEHATGVHMGVAGPDWASPIRTATGRVPSTVKTHKNPSTPRRNLTELIRLHDIVARTPIPVVLHRISVHVLVAQSAPFPHFLTPNPLPYL